MAETFIGIDVSKTHLDVAVRPSGKHERFAYEDDLSRLVACVRELDPVLVTLEATGGYELAVAAALAAAGLSVAIVNPRQVRDFAKAMGRLAKTDTIDADIIAHFGEVARPMVKALPDEQTQVLQDLVRRRRQLLEMLVAEQNRLQLCGRSMRRGIEEHIAWLKKRIKDLDKDIASAVRSSPIWKEKEELLRSVPGVGPVVASTLLVFMPELGTVDRRKIAALAGLAPFNRDSGNTRGERQIWGGRAAVRAALYMAALAGIRYNAEIRAHYVQLVARGTKKKTALIACARKLLTQLNAILRDKKAWSLDRVAAAAS